MEYRGNEDKKERHSKNTERIFNQQTSSKRVVKGSFSGSGEVIPDGNWVHHQ